MKTNDVDIRPMEEPLAELERELLAAYVSGAAPASAHRSPPRFSLLPQGRGPGVAPHCDGRGHAPLTRPLRV